MKTDIPAEETSEICSYCGNPFPDGEILSLHKGRTHVEVLSEEERASVREARELEADELHMFQLKALFVLVLLYFALVLTYAILA